MTTQSSETLQLSLVLLLAMICFLVYGFLGEATYLGYHDGRTYFNLASQSIEKGAFHCGLYNHAFWPPAWVELTALLYRLFGYHPSVVQVFLSFCAVMSALAVYCWARESLGHRLALLGCILSFSSIYIFRISTFHQYELFVGACMVWAAYLTVSDYSRNTCSWAQITKGLLAGLLISVAVLSSAKITLVAIVLLIALLIRSYRSRSFWMVSGYLLIGSLICGFWVLRNYHCFGEFIPVTTNGGAVYYMAHNPLSNNPEILDPSDMLIPVYEQMDIRDYESSRWYELANQYIAEHPGATVKNAYIKFWSFFKPLFADQAIVIFLCLFVLWNRFTGNIVLSRDAHWWAGIPVGFALLHSMYYFEPRYVLPVWPFLALFATQAFTTRMK